MEKICDTCFFYDEKGVCRDSITGIPVKETDPHDSCEDWLECAFACIPERG